MEYALYLIVLNYAEEIETVIQSYPHLINQHYDGKSLLMFACSFSDIPSNQIEKRCKIIKLLLESGARVNEKSQSGCTPLVYFLWTILRIDYLSRSFYAKKIIKVTKLLLENDLDINANIIDDDVETNPIYILLSCGVDGIILEILELLIKKGININKRYSTGLTVIESYINDVVNENVLDYLFDISEVFNLMLKYEGEVGIEISKIPDNSSLSKFIKPLLHSELEKKDRKIIELKEKISKLERENEELRYRPGNSGYLEAMEDFKSNSKKRKKK